MSKLPISKLDNYVCKDGKYPDLEKVYETNNFYLSSNGYMAAAIYKSNDDNLNYTFGNQADIVTSVIKKTREKDRKNIITVNRKDFITKLKETKREFKNQVKGKRLSDNDIVVVCDVVAEKYKLCFYLECRDNNMGENYKPISGKNIDIDCSNNIDINMRFRLDLLINFLDFFLYVDNIDISYIKDDSIIYSRADNKEILLFPVRK
jgi:hypothetical protein